MDMFGDGAPTSAEPTAIVLGAPEPEIPVEPENEPEKPESMETENTVENENGAHNENHVENENIPESTNEAINGAENENGATEEVKNEPIMIEDEQIQDGGVIEDDKPVVEKKPEVQPYISDTDMVQVRNKF